jgi:bifunctional non-homologous end joining protein LigD
MEQGLTALAKYREKRKFAATPEPEGGAVAEGIGRYCVQRHHARHLHYDLRLEVGGTLKSWAVPKGPTLDPAEKRLAMMVEDHPIEYGGFEGVIPAGNYGAGSVMLWDRGSFEVLGDVDAAAQIARGDFKFRLHGDKVQGEFALVRTKRGKGNEWLLIKKKDTAAVAGWDPEMHAHSVLTGRTQEEIAQGLDAVVGADEIAMPQGAVRAEMPKTLVPMLAEIGEGTPPEGEQWLYEVKWDGVRALCFIHDGRVRLVSRNGNAMDAQYPELLVLPHQVKLRDAVLDAEIAALDERGAPSFERLQQRMHVTDAGAVATLRRHCPVVLYAFDLVYANGHDLRGVAVEERKRLLREVIETTDTIRFSEHFAGHGAELLEAVKQQGIEGIVGKRRGSFYASRRGKDWVKYKVQASDTFVICGFTKGERALFGALLLGSWSEGELRWVGNVGTGFDAKGMQRIHDRIAGLVVAECPLVAEKGLPKKDVTWVRPEVACEVRYANRTGEGRLRAPVFIGLRTDVDAGPVREPLLAADVAEVVKEIDGRRLKFTNLNKVFYPAEGFTKRDLLNYYAEVAPLLVPHLKDRPLSLKRYPNGIAEDFFFQKEVAASFPKWLRTELADGVRHVIGDDQATLLLLVNLGCIDHNPWMSRVGSLEHPDYLLIDLDPQECGFQKIVEAALVVRAKLDRAELESYPKTTGGDGMHLFVPLAVEYSFEQVRSFAELLSALVTQQRPDLFTTPRAVAKREKGKVYFDWQQIAGGKTISAPYVARAYAGAPVATPLRWDEVTPQLSPEQFHIGNAPGRFQRTGDLFAGVLKGGQRLESALEKLMG